MAVNSGYNTNTPSDILLDTGVLMMGSTVLGVSRGGLRFSPGIELREVEYDGRKAPVRGLDRIAFRRAQISGRMLEVGSANLRLFEPGGATPNITPTPQGELLATGDYVASLKLVYRRGSGGTCTITFAYALCVRYEIQGN